MKRCKSFLCALLALTMMLGLTMTTSASYIKKEEETVTTKGAAGRCDIMTGILTDGGDLYGVVSITPKSYTSSYYYEAIVSLYVGGALIGTDAGNAWYYNGGLWEPQLWPGTADVRYKDNWGKKSIIVIGQFRTGNGNALYAWDKAVTVTYN